jgi:hypothetical protein
MIREALMQAWPRDLLVAIDWPCYNSAVDQGQKRASHDYLGNIRHPEAESS